MLIKIITEVLQFLEYTGICQKISKLACDSECNQTSFEQFFGCISKKIIEESKI